jgi:hypothetical protein
MPPETEVIACPACRHLVRVPADFLGQTVQCPECRATFRAPVRNGDCLTDPELLSRPDGPAPAARKPADVLLWLPAFGLMLVGFASLAVNGVKSVEYLARPDAAREDVLRSTEAMRKAGLAQDGPADPEERRKFDEQRAAEYVPTLRVLLLASGLVGGVVFAGGLAIALRRYYRLAQVGCVLAALNVAHLCCVPGAIFGLWGLLMLASEEGREHFG